MTNYKSQAQSTLKWLPFYDYMSNAKLTTCTHPCSVCFYRAQNNITPPAMTNPSIPYHQSEWQTHASPTSFCVTECDKSIFIKHIIVLTVIKSQTYYNDYIRQGHLPYKLLILHTIKYPSATEMHWLWTVVCNSVMQGKFIAWDYVCHTNSFILTKPKDTQRSLTNTLPYPWLYLRLFPSHAHTVLLQLNTENTW